MGPKVLWPCLFKCWADWFVEGNFIFAISQFSEDGRALCPWDEGWQLEVREAAGARALLLEDDIAGELVPGGGGEEQYSPIHFSTSRFRIYMYIMFSPKSKLKICSCGNWSMSSLSKNKMFLNNVPLHIFKSSLKISSS